MARGATATDTPSETEEPEVPVEPETPPPTDVPDPTNPEDADKFNSLIWRDTTHFQNLQHGGTEDMDTISGASSPQRVAAAEALLAATGSNVQAGIGWGAETTDAVTAHQGDDGNGLMDRKLWDKLSDQLFGKDDKKKK